jgi:hypothetical protein
LVYRCDVHALAAEAKAKAAFDARLHASQPGSMKLASTRHSVRESTKRVAPSPSVPNPPAPRKPTFVDGVEVAGPGPDTTPSFRAKVQFLLELLDPDVASWWKSNRILGILRSRKTTGWVFWRSTSVSSAENGRPVVIVDEGSTAAEAAEAIVHELRHGHAADSAAALFAQDDVQRGDTVKKFQELRVQAFREAADQAATLAEAYYAGIASISTTGDVIIAIGDVAEDGPQWRQLWSLFPLLGNLPIGAIVIKVGDHLVNLPKKTAKLLEKLTDSERKQIIKAVKNAKDKREAEAQVKREVLKAVGDRQVHHAISATVHEALEEHPILRGKYKLRDKRFETLAHSYEAHSGWQEWHRELDKRVAEWINRHRDATEEVFEAWLREQYNHPALKQRFPSGF